MNQGDSNSSCTTWCRIFAGLIGLIVFLFLMMSRDWAFLAALLAGVILGLICYYVFPMLFCGDTAQQSATDSANAGGSSAQSSNVAAESAASARTTSAAAAAPSASSGGAAAGSTAPAGLMSTDATTSAPAAKKPAAKKPAAKKTAAKKPAAKTAAAKKPAAKTAAAKKPAAKKTAAKTAPAAKTTASKAETAKAAPTKAKTAAKPKRPPVAKDGKPPLLKKARAAGADDLKQIKGVGPGLEKTLNELGFFHFDQVAGWRKKEVEWVDSRLKFKGRIERDEWIKQCKTLAKGGTTEFSKRVKKGDVY